MDILSIPHIFNTIFTPKTLYSITISCLKEDKKCRGRLFGGTVPPNYFLFGGTVPQNNFLFGGTL